MIFLKHLKKHKYGEKNGKKHYGYSVDYNHPIFDAWENWKSSFYFGHTFKKHNHFGWIPHE